MLVIAGKQQAPFPGIELPSTAMNLTYIWLWTDFSSYESSVCACVHWWAFLVTSCKTSLDSWGAVCVNCTNTFAPVSQSMCVMLILLHTQIALTLTVSLQGFLADGSTRWGEKSPHLDLLCSDFILKNPQIKPKSSQNFILFYFL